jgi:hypothetical protein
MSDTKYWYGTTFELYTYKNNAYEDVERIINNGGFRLPAFAIKPQTITDLEMLDWRWLFGELPIGEYVFQKTITNDVDIPGTSIHYDFEYFFTLP